MITILTVTRDRHIIWEAFVTIFAFITSYKWTTYAHRTWASLKFACFFILSQPWELDQEHTRCQNERFLIGRNKTKCENFRGNHFRSYWLRSPCGCWRSLWEPGDLCHVDDPKIVTRWIQHTQLQKRTFPRKFAHFVLFCQKKKKKNLKQSWLPAFWKKNQNT